MSSIRQYAALSAVLALTGCVSQNSFTSVGTSVSQMSSQGGGNTGSYPGITGGTGAYPGGTLPITPSAVCGPSASGQATLTAASNISAVLYKSNCGDFVSCAPSVVQTWDSANDQSILKSTLTAMQPFTLGLNQALGEGEYTVVMYDSSKAQAPYSYTWTNSKSAVAPVLDTIASTLDINAIIRVDSSGNVQMTNAYHVLVGFTGAAQCQGAGTIDPLTINFGSGSISLSAQAQGVSMDLDGNGTNDQISWPLQPEQVGFLVNLSNPLPSNGAIGPSQIFGNYTVGPDGKVASNGYDALAKYDSNGDGVINSLDPIWSSLRVWKDLNRNGLVDANELISLADAGVLSIELPTFSGGHVAKESCQSDSYGNVLCNGHGAYVNLQQDGKTVRKQLTDIGFKPLN